MALTDKDREQCRLIAVLGAEGARAELKMKKGEFDRFLGRTLVAREVQRQMSAFEDRRSIQERAAFYLQQELNKLAWPSLTVLARALQGDKVNRVGEVEEAAPTSAQVYAAIDILNRCKVSGNFSADAAPPTIDIKQFNLAIGLESSDNNPTAVVVREKLRGSVGKLLGLLQHATKDGGFKEEDVIDADATVKATPRLPHKKESKKQTSRSSRATVKKHRRPRRKKKDRGHAE